MDWEFEIRRCKVVCLGFPGGTSGKESACQCRRFRRYGFHPRMGKIFWSRKWQPTQVFLLGKFHDTGAWWAIVHGVTKELDVTEDTNTHKLLCVCVCVCI